VLDDLYLPGQAENMAAVGETGLIGELRATAGGSQANV
jgi:hypothetical protein